MGQNLLISKNHMVLKIERYLWFIGNIIFQYSYEIKAN